MTPNVGAVPILPVRGVQTEREVTMTRRYGLPATATTTGPGLSGSACSMPRRAHWITVEPVVKDVVGRPASSSFGDGVTRPLVRRARADPYTA
jgi:hypothetical protein